MYNLCKPNADFDLWERNISEQYSINYFRWCFKTLWPKITYFYHIFYVTGYGVGAVLSHKLNGEDKSVLFASSKLTPTEQKYSNL